MLKLTMALNCCCVSALRLPTTAKAAPRASRMDCADGACADAVRAAAAAAAAADDNDNIDEDAAAGSRGGDCDDMSGLRPCKDAENGARDT